MIETRRYKKLGFGFFLDNSLFSCKDRALERDRPHQRKKKRSWVLDTELRPLLHFDVSIPNALPKKRNPISECTLNRFGTFACPLACWLFLLLLWVNDVADRCLSRQLPHSLGEWTYCCVFRSWWAYFTNIALCCIHWMMAMFVSKCLNNENQLQSLLPPQHAEFDDVLLCCSVSYRQLGPAGVFVWARSAVPSWDGTANNLIWPTWVWRQS